MLLPIDAENTRARAGDIEIGQFMMAGESTSPGQRIGSDDNPMVAVTTTRTRGPTRLKASRGQSPAPAPACRRCEADRDHPIEAAPGAKLIRINMAQRASRYFFADE